MELALYGGFTGIESSLSERNHSTNETILSGDLAQDDGLGLENNSENTYHVLTGSGTDSTAVLDGFTIQGGNAFNNTTTTFNGGGLHNEQGSPSLANCIFQDNTGNLGGAVYNSSSSPSFANCIFVNNFTFSASGARPAQGGAISNNSSSPSFTNCIFQGNTAVPGEGRRGPSSEGGAICNFSSSPSLINCSFQGNSASVGGAIADNVSSSPSLTNCILWDNFASTFVGFRNTSVSSSSSSSPSYSHCLIQHFSKRDLDDSSLSSNNNLAPSDPFFASSQDLRLQPNSPAINSGDSLANSEALDLDGNPRLVPIAIDLGAYESSQVSGPNLSDLYLPSPAAETSIPLWAPDTSLFNNGWDSPSTSVPLWLTHLRLPSSG